MKVNAGAKFLFLSLATLILIVPATAYALRPPSIYACLAKDADNIAIVMASNAKPKKVYTDYFGIDYYLLQLEVEEQIYLFPTKNKQKTISLLSRRPGGGYVEDAGFNPGVSYLVFLKQAENGPVVLDGSQGALPFEKGKVEIHGKMLSTHQAKIFIRKAQGLDIQCQWH